MEYDGLNKGVWNMTTVSFHAGGSIELAHLSHQRSSYTLSYLSMDTNWMCVFVSPQNVVTFDECQDMSSGTCEDNVSKDRVVQNGSL